jgi:hypothetical protein
LRTKREISGATWLRPKPSVAFTRSRPRGVALLRPAAAPVVDLAQDAARVLQVQLALGREAHAAGAAVDQRHAQARFHLRQVLADRRRGDAQLTRRRAQAAGAGQRGREEPQVGGLDAVCPSSLHPALIVNFRLNDGFTLAPFVPGQSYSPEFPRATTTRRRHRMKTYRIATIPGDGIGKEVVPAGQQVLQALAAAGQPSPSTSRPSAGAATGTAPTAR